MFKRIPGNYDYLISVSGEISCLRGDILKPPIVDGKITIEMYGGIRCFDVNWLGLVAHFEVDLPNNLEDIYFVDITTNLVKVVCGKVMRFTRPVMAGHNLRRIPGYTKYGISKEGRLYDLDTVEEIQPLLTQKYPTVNVRDADRGCKKAVFLHRLVALAWVGNEDFVTKPIVNHIDGNKLNNNIDNLRWATHQENNRNSQLSTRNTSGVKGVTFNKRDKKWFVQLRVNSKCHSFGYYDDKELAELNNPKQSILSKIFKANKKEDKSTEIKN